MGRTAPKRLAAAIRRLVGADRGGVAVYTAFFATAALGAGALALDIGRMSVLRAQMQHRADAGAMAGATQLDGRPGAQERARRLAVDAISQTSGIPGDGGALSVESVRFFSAVAPDPVPATGDEDSLFLDVVLAPKRIDFLLGDAVTATGRSRSAAMTARAVAQPRPYICDAPPLMLCDPAEANQGFDLDDPATIGRLIRLKPPPGGGSWAPGNFGLLALPDGTIGASALSNALAAVEPAECYSLDVTTAPGVKFNQIRDGLNARFDLPGGGPWPAPNVINYPRDANQVSDPDATFGSGAWDLDGYWHAKHGGSPPGDLAGATRYQVYLYEMGEAFARSGRQTLWPLPETLPEGFAPVTPPGPNLVVDAAHPHDPDHDGAPSQPVASNGPARRLLKVAVLECVAEGVRGRHTYPTNGNFVEVFMTETVDEAPEGALYGEFVRPLSPGVDPGFHANVRLVD